MRRAFSILTGCFLLAFAASPQEAQKEASRGAEALPSVNQILDKYVQALGGRAAVEKLSSRVSKGSIEILEPGLSGTIEVYAKAPNKSALVVNLEGFGVVRQGFDGTEAWSENPQVGLRELSGDELANAKRGAEFYQPIKLRELYPNMTVKGREKVGEREAYLLEADPGAGGIRRMDFDTETGLMIRSLIERETPAGRFTVETLLEDYKEVDGFKVPFTVRQMNPNYSSVTKFQEIKHNVAIDDAKFSKPQS